MVELCIVYYELFPQNQILDTDKYSSHLDWLKVTIDEKRPELANRRAVISYQKKHLTFRLFGD